MIIIEKYKNHKALFSNVLQPNDTVALQKAQTLLNKRVITSIEVFTDPSRKPMMVFHSDRYTITLEVDNTNMGEVTLSGVVAVIRDTYDDSVTDVRVAISGNMCGLIVLTAKKPHHVVYTRDKRTGQFLDENMVLDDVILNALEHHREIRVRVAFDGCINVLKGTVTYSHRREAYMLDVRHANNNSYLIGRVVLIENDGLICNTITSVQLV